MNSPIPPDFGWRYVAWALWCNAITILMTLQGVFSLVTLNPDLMSHGWSHAITVANCILCIIIAQVKKNFPPSPPPTKAS